MTPSNNPVEKYNQLSQQASKLAEEADAPYQHVHAAKAHKAAAKAARKLGRRGQAEFHDMLASSHMRTARELVHEG